MKAKDEFHKEQKQKVLEVIQKKKCILKHNYEYNFRSSLRKNA